MVVALGDPHNFGRKVTLLGNGLIQKPRSLLLESIFLNSESKFRQSFDTKIVNFFQHEISDSVFPNLNFSKLYPPIYDGEVTKVFVEPVHEITSEILIKMGIIIGFCSFYGIGDLHDQNMVFGKIPNSKQIICSPLDVESIFSLCRLPSQTLLIPSKYATFEACGLNAPLRLLSSIIEKRHEEVTKIVYGYIKTIDLLKSDFVLNNLLISSLPLDTPIRVIIRNTQDYYNFFKNQLEYQFTMAERAQLERGDIPYFYRIIFKKDIMWLKEDSKDWHSTSTKLTGFELHKDLKEIIETSLQMGVHPAINDLELAAPLQIFRNLFPRNHKDLESSFKDLKIKSSINNIIIMNMKGFEWSCNY